MHSLHARLAAAVVAIVSSLSPLVVSAQVATMDFSTLLPFGYYTALAQGFGDRAGLDVSNTTRTAFNNSAEVACSLGGAGHHLDLWTAGYSDLSSAALACANGNVGELSFAPTAGKQVTLQSFRLGSYLGQPNAIELHVYDASWTSRFDFVGSVTAGIDLTPNITSASTLYLQWGTSYNTGVNLVTTNLTDVEGTPPSSTVPEPSTIALLASGLGALLITAKRRTHRA